MYTSIHLYIYTYTYILGAKDCTPEIDTSEVIADFQWHVPMDFHVFSNGNSLFGFSFQRIFTFPVDFTGIVQWMFSDIFQWHFTFVISGV